MQKWKINELSRLGDAWSSRLYVNPIYVGLIIPNGNDPIKLLKAKSNKLTSKASSLQFLMYILDQKKSPTIYRISINI